MISMPCPRTTGFKAAGQNIVKHGIANNNWDDDWIFDDKRFGLKDELDGSELEREVLRSAKPRLEVFHCN